MDPQDCAAVDPGGTGGEAASAVKVEATPAVSVISPAAAEGKNL